LDRSNRITIRRRPGKLIPKGMTNECRPDSALPEVGFLERQNDGQLIYAATKPTDPP
jgi:hypothetical protein